MIDIEQEMAIAVENTERAMADIPKELSEIEEKLPERIRLSGLKPVDKQSMLHSYVDKLLGSISAHTACKKGCTHCCHYNVDVNEVEVRLISEFSGFGAVFDTTVPHPPVKDGSACPFLKDDKCSIYPVRPYVCRTHVAMTRDDYFCEFERSEIHATPHIAFGGLAEAYVDILEQTSTRAAMDIRYVFPNVVAGVMSEK